MLKQFLHHIEHHQLCQKKDRILVTVSGGLDSMVMLDLFREAGYSIGVAHCNFQLRGEESDGDERFVKDVCQKNNIPFFQSRFDTLSYAEENGLSVQMAARELRYDWFNEILEKEKFNVVATAHQLNDSIETMLLNWINGRGLEGLVGIPVKRDRVIRPLLFATRGEIEKYALEMNLQWREDSSNSATDYQRNFIRHKVVPLLKELNASLEQTLQRGLGKLTGEVEMLEASFSDWKEKFSEFHREKIIIKKEAFDRLPHGAVLLWKMVSHLGFNYEVCLSVIENLRSQPGKKFIGPAHHLVIDREELIVYPQPDFWRDTIVEKGSSKAVLGSWTMEIRELYADDNDQFELKPGSRYEAKLDLDKLTYPLRWRCWKAGDVFYPLGMEHRKKVSDLLIDEKVSLADKTRVTVLESDDQIVWVVGQRIDNRYKITNETQRAIHLSVAPYFL